MVKRWIPLLVLFPFLILGLLIACTPGIEQAGPYTVTGTVTIFGNLISDPPATPETIRIGIDTSLTDMVTLDIPNVDYMVESSIAEGTATYAYSIAAVPAGTYYLAGSIDAGGGGDIGLGDYAFIYGNLNPGDPMDPSDDPPANVVIDGSHTVFNFTLLRIPCIVATWTCASMGPFSNVVFTVNPDASYSISYTTSASNTHTGTFAPTTMPASIDLTATVATSSGPDVPPPGGTWLMKYANLTTTSVDIWIDTGSGYAGPYACTKS